MKTIEIPESSLVVLCGPAGCGKSSFAKKHFIDTQIVSSDHCRALVSDDEENMAVSHRAFRVFKLIIDQRLASGRLTVADSTALTAKARQDLIALARKHDTQTILLVFDTPLAVCLSRNRERTRKVPDSVILSHCHLLDKVFEQIPEEDFDQVHILDEIERDEVQLTLIPSAVDLLLNGPFDIIGDIHGCCEEIEELLSKLGYVLEKETYRHPNHRKAIFLGDLGDRGPRCLDSINLVMDMVDTGHALYVPGNHCRKLNAFFCGRNIKVAHGLEKTLAELDQLDPADRQRFTHRFMAMYSNALPYLVLDGGRLVVSHAGIKENMIGRLSKRVREFCLFGDTTGDVTEDGLPIRRDWALHYRGHALVVYGHTPVIDAQFRNNTIDIDQGCVLGGKLTALRYPEREIVQVNAKAVYYCRDLHQTWPVYTPATKHQHSCTGAFLQ